MDTELKDLADDKPETCHDSVMCGFNLEEWGHILWMMFCFV